VVCALCLATFGIKFLIDKQSIDKVAINQLKFSKFGLGESPLNRNDPKSEQYSLDLLKRVILNFQSVWRHRSELGYVPVKGTLPYKIGSSFEIRQNQVAGHRHR
jgi:hypothetical protein